MNIMYILQNGDTNQYKIGVTNNLNRRLSQLQTGCPLELKVVKIWQHPKRKIIERYERILHRCFTAMGQKIRDDGEWFTLYKADVVQLCKPQTIAEQNEMALNFLEMTHLQKTYREVNSL